MELHIAALPLYPSERQTGTSIVLKQNGTETMIHKIQTSEERKWEKNEKRDILSSEASYLFLMMAAAADQTSISCQLACVCTFTSNSRLHSHCSLLVTSVFIDLLIVDSLQIITNTGKQIWCCFNGWNFYSVKCVRENVNSVKTDKLFSLTLTGSRIKFNRGNDRSWKE